MVTKANRVRRNPINGTRSILGVTGQDPKYVYRIVNDDGDRVAIFEELGYEIVSDKSVKVGDRRIANPTQEGSPVTVSVGGGTRGVVMRIPREYFEEDQQAKQEAIASVEEEIKHKDADYGKLNITR